MSLESGTNEYSIDKSIHFTYKSNPDMQSLCQGDILNPTEELMEVLKTVHPYFLNKQYKYFMVLSQSCDLVRRNGEKMQDAIHNLSGGEGLYRVFEKGFAKW